MDTLELMKKRHAVRSYTDKALEAPAVEAIREQIDVCNREGGLHIQLCLDEPEAFAGMMARYGHFSGVRQYIAMAGKKGPDLDEKIGYYGERLVLLATGLGLGTCWVAATYSKRKCPCRLERGEKLVVVIALGYAEKKGAAHKSKPLEELCRVDGDMPGWFRRGMEAALLAPTAMNQQKFLFTLKGDTVAAQALKGPYTKLDLGIVKYHFERGASADGWSWAT